MSELKKNSVPLIMILTKTTELGLQSILFLAQQERGYLVNPQQLAERLEESPTYMAKVLRLLAQAGLVRSHRGAAGGFELVRSKESLTLLDVLEACQGPIRGNYCAEVPPEQVPLMCGYHQAMHELKESCRGVLARWTIAQILNQPEARMPSPACQFRRVRIKFDVVSA
jgi:Rrf2 family protein